MIREEIRNLIRKSIKKLKKEKIFSKFEIPEIQIEKSEEKTYGDYATSIALSVATKVKKSPMEIARILSEHLLKLSHNQFEKIEVAKPGFLNLWINKNELERLFLKVVNQGLKIFQKKLKKRETIVIEYSSPNIAKPLGVHHLRSTIIGQALVNILRFFGHRVISLSFPGDWGTQFGWLLAAYKKWGESERLKKYTVLDMLELYVRFSKEVKRNPKLLEEAKLEFKKLEEGDPENRRLWQVFSKESYREFNRIYKLLDVKIENTIGESFYQPDLKLLVQDTLKRNLAEYGQDGTVIIKLPDSPIPEIIQKSDGATIFTTRELAAIKHRFKKWRASKIIYVAANQQTFHLKQVFSAAEKLGFCQKDQLIHVKFGTMLGPGGKKFATREGRLIPLEEVLQEAIKRAKEVVGKLNPSLSKKEKEKVARMVGIGALKFFDLSRNRLSDIIFDWDQMLNLKGFSAPYIQYTYARLCSILRKAHFRKEKTKSIFITHPLEREIILNILRFDEIIEEVVQNYFPNRLAEYLYYLSNLLNNFYETLPVLKAERKEKQSRLNIVWTAKETLKTGLNLLGIDAPKKM